MAKKGNRVQVILECTEHKDSGMPGTSRYITTKNKKNSQERPKSLPKAAKMEPKTRKKTCLKTSPFQTRFFHDFDVFLTK